TMYQAPIMVTKGDRKIVEMFPARAKYPTSSDLLHEVAVAGSLWKDFYITLTDFDRETGGEATIRININPTVRFVWIATFIVVIGGLIALLDPYRGDRTRDVVAGSWEAAP